MLRSITFSLAEKRQCLTENWGSRADGCLLHHWSNHLIYCCAFLRVGKCSLLAEVRFFPWIQNGNSLMPLVERTSEFSLVVRLERRPKVLSDWITPDKPLHMALWSLHIRQAKWLACIHLYVCRRVFGIGEIWRHCKKRIKYTSFFILQSSFSL